MSSPIARLTTTDRRLLPLVTVLPYALLAVLTVVTVILKWHDPGGLLVDLGLCALTGAWLLLGFTLRPRSWERPLPMTVFVAGLIVLTAILVLRGSWWGFFTPAPYIFAFNLLRWPWRLLGGSAVAVVAGMAQASGVSLSTAGGAAVYAAILAANVVIMGGVCWAVTISDRQDQLRDQALAEVREANDRLRAALAENAGLHEQLLVQAREAGVSDERQRMAREIHDTLAQGLTGIITQLQAAEQAAVPPAAGGWLRHVQAATGLARESLSEARRSVHELRPEPLETARLGDALAQVAERWSGLHAIPVQVTTTGTPRPMHAEAELALLRTAQEALANVARHAGATRVGVTLSYLDEQVALDVRDDGRGFDPGLAGAPASPAFPASPASPAFPAAAAPAPAPGGGFGLVAMRQRIEALSGILQVESEPGAGTGISACIPVAAGGGQ